MSMTYRKVPELEYGKVVEFLQAVAPRYGFSDEWFQWKYMGNPAGVPHIYFAEDAGAGALAGVYCVIAWNLTHQGVVYPCVQSVDTMIHPEYRGHGIVEALFHFMVEDLKGTRVVAIFGFPNEKFFPITLKLGARHLGNMGSYTKPLSIKLLAGKAKGTLPGPIFSILDMAMTGVDSVRRLVNCRGAVMQEVDSFQGIDNIDTSSGASIRSYRSYEYLTWRYIKKPGASYRIHCMMKDLKRVCWVVSRDSAEDVTLLDIIADSDRSLVPALLLFSDAMKREGKTGIRIACFGAISNRLKSAGFLYREKGLPVTYYPVHGDSPIMSQPLQWHIMLGDLDAA